MNDQELFDTYYADLFYVLVNYLEQNRSKQLPLTDVNLNELLPLFSSKNSKVLHTINFNSKYYGRALSTFANILLEKYNDKETLLTSLSEILLETYGYKWYKYLRVIQTNYDAIKPFDITLNETTSNDLNTTKDSGTQLVNITLNNNKTNNNTHTKQGSITNELNTSENTTESITKDETKHTIDESETNDSVVISADTNTNIGNSIYGFNSVSQVPTDNSNQSTNSTSETKNPKTKKGTNIDERVKDSNISNESNTSETQWYRNLQDVDSGTFVERGDKSDNSSYNKEYGRVINETKNYTRKGNIGNTSQQELLQQEIELWKFQIYDVIYNDIATVLFRAKYI